MRVHWICVIENVCVLSRGIRKNERLTALLYLTACIQRVMDARRRALISEARAKGPHHHLHADRHVARTRVLSLSCKFTRTCDRHA